MKTLLLGFMVSLLGLSCGKEEQKASNVKAIGACVRGHMGQECANRYVCKTVCTGAAGGVGNVVGGGFGVGAGVAVGGQVCSDLCEYVPECTPLYICDQYESTPF